MTTLAAVIAAASLLPGFAPYANGPDGGTVLAGVFPGGARTGYVYLPPRFDPSHRYPVVYLLHGMPGSPSEYLAGANLIQYADVAIAAGTIRPFIAVLPPAGVDSKYNGEWAGIWERQLVDEVVPFVDANLPTIASPAGRAIGGLSAGGFGAVYIGIRHPGLFGRILSWSGYFHPLRDGPFSHDSAAQLQANDPRAIVTSNPGALRHDRFFLSTGPYHSHWFRPAETFAFARRLEKLGLSVTTLAVSQRKGEYSRQLAAGLGWMYGN